MPKKSAAVAPRERIYIEMQCDVPGYTDLKIQAWGNYKELWRRRLMYGAEAELMNLLRTQPFIRSWNLVDEDTGEALPVPHDNPQMKEAEAALEAAQASLEAVRAEIEASEDDRPDELVERLNKATEAVMDAQQKVDEAQPLLRVPYQVSVWVIKAVTMAPNENWGKGETKSDAA